MPRNRNNNVDIESLKVTLTIKQILAAISAVFVIITTACSYTYAFAQSKSASEMTLHVIEDKKLQVEDTKVHNEKDMEIIRLRNELEQLKSEQSSQKLPPPPKRPALVVSVVKVPKQCEK